MHLNSENLIKTSCSKLLYPFTFFDHDRSLEQTLKSLKDGRGISVIASHVSSKALFISLLAPRLKSSVVVLAKDEDYALKLKNDIETFLHVLYNSPPPCIFFPELKRSHESLLIDTSKSNQRINCLNVLLKATPHILVCSTKAFMRRTIPKDQFFLGSFILKKDDRMDTDHLINKLIELGYSKESNVELPAQFAVRGGIVDLFSPSYPHPVRVEFFGDEIEQIKKFDAQIQLSTGDIKSLEVIPSREIVFSKENIKTAQSSVRLLCEQAGVPKRKRDQILNSIDRSNEVSPSLLPAYYKETSTVFDYLSKDSLLIAVNSFAVKNEAFNIEKEEFEVHNDLIKREEFSFHPNKLYLDSQSFSDRINSLAKLQIDDIYLENKNHSSTEFKTELINVFDKSKNSIKPSLEFIKILKKRKTNTNNTALFYEHANQAKKTKDFLAEHKIATEIAGSFSGKNTKTKDASRILIFRGTLNDSFVVNEHDFAFIDENSLFKRKSFGYAQQDDSKKSFFSLKDLEEGDYVVHSDHGIARYLGLKHITAGNLENDFMLLEYAHKDKLYLPVYRMNLIHKYISKDSRKPLLSRLSSRSWERTKLKASKAIKEIAFELVKLYAKRKITEGYAYNQPDDTYRHFESLFPYQETRDQSATIDAVLNDMTKPKPMDRLVCGDVGYGKTEIAMRASYLSAVNGKQVAVLVPTTVLAQQHFETFSSRFKDFPINVDFLSRFKSKALQKKSLLKLKSGNTDILIGTHRLISDDVSFKDLGLLIIDEEHRFGVKHKEKIKRFRDKIDVLALSATPIPRSLEISLIGLRDLSVIDTPPPDRKSINTFVAKYNDTLIKDACEREINRNGQVFFVHNRVETIENEFKRLKTILPGAKIAVAHGQMHENKLQKVMIDFLNRKYDILLCTAIIESGLDIPNANTIIINRSDTLGLAQLYQLRGRVGRSKEAAYAYFLIPKEGNLSPEAVKRIKVLRNFCDLGSGIKIALHDLEIRGAGNIFGESQSGHIQALGLEMYTKILERAIKKLKGEDVEDDFEPQLKVNLEAFIQNSYIADVNERLSYYKRLAQAKSDEEISLIETELIDRFGPIPQKLKTLLLVTSLKVFALKFLIEELYIDKSHVYIICNSKTLINEANIVSALSEKLISYTDEGKIRLKLPSKTAVHEKIIFAKKMLLKLFQYVT